MIMEHPASVAVQPTPQNRLRSTSGENLVGMTRRVAVCTSCGSLTYIRETEIIENAMCPRCHGQLRKSSEEGMQIGHVEPIQSSCPQCKSVLHIPPALAGRHVFCIACGCRLSVKLTVQIDPAPQARTEPPEKEPPVSVAKIEADDRMIRVTCECGKRLKAEPFAAGRTVDCPRCGRPVTFPDKRITDDEINSTDVNCHPKTTDAGVPLSATTETPQCPSLPPHEAAVAARDHTIDAALHCLVYGSPSAHSQSAELQDEDARLFLNMLHAAWLWPAAVAVAATGTMAILLRTFVMGF